MFPYFTGQTITHLRLVVISICEAETPFVIRNLLFDLLEVNGAVDYLGLIGQRRGGVGHNLLQKLVNGFLKVRVKALGLLRHASASGPCGHW